MAIQFDEYKYYPALRTRAAELVGLKNLEDRYKEKIIPLITLGKWPRSEDIQSSLDKTIEAVGNYPFFLDVTREVKHHNGSSQALLDSSGNFQAWRRFVSQNNNIIPVIQMTDSARLREITTQVKTFEQECGNVAFRVTNFQRDIPRVISCLVSMDSPENAIIFLDLNYIRGNLPVATAAAVSAINQLRQEVPETIVSILSTSFPSSVTAFCQADNQRGVIDIMERELFQSIGGNDVCIYGDHSSIHAVVYEDVGGRYVPRIDLPLDDAWYFERRPSTDSIGYVDAAAAILAAYPAISENASWGAEMIKNAARGEIAGMGSPAKWIAVRVNLHIARQIELSESLGNDLEDDEDF